MKKKHKFMIEPSEAQFLMESAGLSNVADLLPTLVPTAQSLAQPLISSFPVGCVGLGSTGRIYLGCNLEFPGLPLHHSVHAEQFLVANASAHDEPQIQFIAVIAAPCGHCRQFFQELRDAARLQILVTSDPDPAYRPLIGFLPRPFGPVEVEDDGELGARVRVWEVKAEGGVAGWVEGMSLERAAPVVEVEVEVDGDEGNLGVCRERERFGGFVEREREGLACLRVLDGAGRKTEAEK